MLFRSVDPATTVDLEYIQRLISDGEQQRALRLLNELSVDNPQNYAVSLLKAWLLMNSQAFVEADQCLEDALTLEPWSVDAMLMKGLICKWQNEPEQACQWFKKVIYTRPECWPAHYYLADIRRLEEHADAAMQSYQIVLRVLAANSQTDRSTDWIPLPLAASDAIFLSQRHTQQLTASLQVDS